MEEKITVQNNDLEKAVGGNEVLFHEGKPVCPICGKYPIPLVSGDEFTDIYQCDCCGQQSVHTKKTNTASQSGPAYCPRCGSTSFRVLRTEGGLSHVECSICRMQWSKSAA